MMKNKIRLAALAILATGCFFSGGCKSFQASNVTGGASFTDRNGQTVSGSDSAGNVSISN